MNFNLTTGDKNGIIQEEERMTRLGSTGISGVAAVLLDFTAYNNETLSDLWHVIYGSCGNWEYDDSNQTDLPQAKTDFTSGTSKYPIPTGTAAIEKIEVYDSSGNSTICIPITKEMVNVAMDEFEDTSGVPKYYRLIGDTIEFKPSPNYTTTSNTGFKVYFDRGKVAFASTATTTAPGFFSEFHYLVPLGGSIKWYKIFKPTDPSLQLFALDYEKGKMKLAQFYRNRFKAYKPRVGRMAQSFK